MLVLHHGDQRPVAITISILKSGNTPLICQLGLFLWEIVFVIPLIVKVTMRRKLRFIRHIFLRINTLQILNHIKENAQKQHQYDDPPIMR